MGLTGLNPRHQQGCAPPGVSGTILPLVPRVLCLLTSGQMSSAPSFKDVCDDVGPPPGNLPPEVH